MILALLVAVAGGAGAACRYLVDGWIQQRWGGPFPMGTFVVNVSGSLALGVLTGFFMVHASAPGGVRTVAGTGFVGAYTTFSTLAFESFRSAREGARRYALLNVFGSLAGGLTAAGLGLWLGRSL